MMDDYIAIEKLIADTIGLDADTIGRSFLARAVATQAKRNDISDPAKYFNLLIHSQEKMEALIEDVVIPETWFFRDQEPFAFLRKHLQEHWQPAHAGKTLRILSIPCSTGEEAYSIAITLLDAGYPPDTFNIDAVDISRKALAAARRAVYGKGSFRGDDCDYQKRYFTQTTDGLQLSGMITQPVQFYQDNLLSPSFLSHHPPYPIIFCRNLLIYLNDSARKQVLNLIERLLLPDGILFCGHSEVSFWTQYGYKAVAHPRAFACFRAPQKTSSEKKKPAYPMQRTKSPAPLRQAAPTSRAIGARQNIAPSAYKTPQAMLDKARHLADQGEMDKALCLCRAYLEKDPHNPEAYCLLGLISEATERLSQAEEYYQKALYLDPCHYEALVHAGLLFQQNGDRVKAALYKERAERCERTPNGRTA